jgi:hypothetical protein
MPSQNFLTPTSFVLQIDKTVYPEAEFTIQTMVLPDVIVDGAPLSTPSRNIAIASDKIVYGPFECSFIVDEDLVNYQEIYDWLYNQVNDNDSASNVRDVTLNIYSSANNLVKQIRFIDAYPTSLSALPFDITIADIEYLTAIISFNYSYFEIV